MDEIVDVEGDQLSFISSVIRERGQVCLLPPERIFGPCDAMCSLRSTVLAALGIDQVEALLRGTICAGCYFNHIHYSDA